MVSCRDPGAAVNSAGRTEGSQEPPAGQGRWEECGRGADRDSGAAASLLAVCGSRLSNFPGPLTGLWWAPPDGAWTGHSGDVTTSSSSILKDKQVARLTKVMSKGVRTYGRGAF